MRRRIWGDGETGEMKMEMRGGRTPNIVKKEDASVDSAAAAAMLERRRSKNKSRCLEKAGAVRKKEKKQEV